MFKVAVIFALLSVAIAFPMAVLDYEYNVEPKEDYFRVRRSPQTLGVNGQVLPGGAGSVRADLEVPMWTSRNGAHNLQGGAFYQRNFNMPGPREDWGANIGYTWKF